jgi:hypothetical protein
MNVVQMAAGNLQMTNGNCQLTTAKWLLTTGCLQTSAGRKLLLSNPGRRHPGNGVRVNRK